MQWTRELNDLLNQCVFASSYDFEASSELFCQQATKFRLWSGEGEVALTATQCQEQWMALNPTEEEEYDDQEDKVEGPETQVDAVVEEEEGYVVVPAGGPRLELSLSDAELDQLLSTLPTSEEPEDDCRASSADTKSTSTHSEMQWVLAFLTDPDAIARSDVEAKNLLGPDKRDDNYQVFLQDLQDANLLAPAPISAVERQSQNTGKVSVKDTDERDNDSGDDDD